MHDGTIADGGYWLSSNLPAILGSPEYESGSTVVFITWDEGCWVCPLGLASATSMTSASNL